MQETIQKNKKKIHQSIQTGTEASLNGSTRRDEHMDIRNTKNGVRTQKIRTKQGVQAFLQENWAYRGPNCKNSGAKTDLCL
jgi:hypothetical protein